MRSRPTLSWSGSAGTAVVPCTTDVRGLAELVGHGGVVVLSGAGISTESGIPDYRGASGTLRKHTPMTYGELVGSEAARRRYWARSHLGWHTIARAQPNDGHRTVAALQADGYIDGVITQNVDGLHQAAGARDVVDLHGSLDRVICLNCRDTTSRLEHHRRLLEANPGFAAEVSRINPDGDADLPAHAVEAFRIVGCRRCRSTMLKPDVVFFGENVPKARVDRCYRLIDEGRSLLVLGSSLTVMSGFRFVRYAAKAGKAVAIVNQGETRGDRYAVLRVDRPLGEALTKLTSLLPR